MHKNSLNNMDSAVLERVCIYAYFTYFGGMGNNANIGTSGDDFR